ncbi:MAG: hypothetical protein U9R56_02205 [candidate division Zixibacteria bacterium]|nr:hypothetical protein [candidate division Zixibacteria bacterium]
MTNMYTDSENKTALYLLIAVIVAFVAGRFFGGQLFDNNWSFIHWQHQPGWYSIVWLSLLVVLTLIVVTFIKRIAELFTSKVVLVVAVAGLFLLLILFRFDSFVYGEGNMRVAQISQVPKIIFRWYEFGSIALVSWLYWFFSLFDLHPHTLTASNTAAVYGWNVFSFTCTLASLIGCVKLAGELATDAVRRFCLFIILFFGPQTILYFGFTGIEPVIVAVTIWFALMSVKLNRRLTTNRVLSLWLITAIGIVLHFSLVYLLPAAVYLSARYLAGKNSQAARFSRWSSVAGFIGWAMLMIAVYYWGNRSFEFSRYLLFLNGKSPFGDYGLFSARHLGDVIQLFFLAAPTILIAKYLWCRRIKSFLTDANLVTASLMALAGNAALVVLDPASGIVFDFPRFVAYLFPLSFLLAILVADVNIDVKQGRLLLGFLTVVSLLLPLSYLPTYLRINIAETYATDYLDKHEFYNRNGCLAFRDAYFYLNNPENGTIDKANTWEWSLTTRAHDYLCFRGASDLATSGDVREAIGVLYQMKAQNPYWSEIRALLAKLLISEGRYDQARMEIDSTLMLEPYRKEHHMNLYTYYRDTKNYHEALKAVNRAEELFPGDLEIITDKMIINFRAGKHDTAESLASFLLETDASLPYPYLILGFLEDARKDIRAAAHYYERFVTLAPNQSETPRIQKRLQELETLLREQQ